MSSRTSPRSSVQADYPSDVRRGRRSHRGWCRVVRSPEELTASGPLAEERPTICVVAHRSLTHATVTSGSGRYLTTGRRPRRPRHPRIGRRPWYRVPAGGWSRFQDRVIGGSAGAVTCGAAVGAVGEGDLGIVPPRPRGHPTKIRGTGSRRHRRLPDHTKSPVSSNASQAGKRDRSGHSGSLHRSGDRPRPTRPHSNGRRDRARRRLPNGLILRDSDAASSSPAQHRSNAHGLLTSSLTMVVRDETGRQTGSSADVRVQPSSHSRHD